MKTKDITLLALFLSLAVILSYIESFIPSFGIPGIKIGLANILIIVVLYNYGTHYSIIISLLRVLLVSLLRGNLFQIGFFMSFCGALLSLLIMIILKLCVKKIHIITVSVIGSIFHIIGQIVVAMIFINDYRVIYYFPFIFLSAIIMGIFVGLIANNILRIKFIQRH